MSTQDAGSNRPRWVAAGRDMGSPTVLAITALSLPATAHARVMKDPAVYATATPPATQPDFVVTLPAADEPADAAPPPPVVEGDESAMTRINLRLPEPLKAGIEQAAARERLSVNAWLVRAAGAALDGPPARPRGGRVGQSFTGWVQ